MRKSPRSLPREVKTKQDVANFFAYVMVRDNIALDTNADFAEYVEHYDAGDRLGTRPIFKGAALEKRRELLEEAYDVCDREQLDIDAVALYTLALTGIMAGYIDPRVKADAPAWIVRVSRGWSPQ